MERLRNLLWPRSRWGPGPRRDDGLEPFSCDDQVVRLFLVATLAWGILALGLAALAQLLLVAPRASLGLPFLAFGRIDPLQAHLAVFGFAGNAMFAGIYHSTQRLCATRMWSDMLSRLHFWGWQLCLIAALLTLPLGINQGRELAGLAWPIDLLLAVAWTGFFVPNFFMTLRQRRRRLLHVAIWFYIAAVVAFPILHVLNNLAAPAGLFSSYSLFAGVQDALIQGWYRNGLWAFFLGAPFVGLMYYLLGTASDRPLFSHRLAILHFWSLVLLLGWAGPRYLQNTAAPEWLGSVGTAFGLPIAAVALAGIINVVLTLGGKWRATLAQPAMRFLLAGAAMLALIGIDVSLRSFKSVNAVLQYTDWAAGELHFTLLGFSGMLAFALIYWLAAPLSQASTGRLWSARLAHVHFWIALAGTLLVVVSGYASGLSQGRMWLALTPEGQPAHPVFIGTVLAVQPFRWLGVAGGGLYFAGALLCAANVYRTWREGPAVYEEPTVLAEPLAGQAEAAPVRPRSRWEGLHSVAELARRLEVFATLWWHRGWEGRAALLTGLTLAAVAAPAFAMLLAGGAVPSAVPAGDDYEPLSPLEVRGRDLYIAEGCYRCHTQQVRPLFAETRRYGDYSRSFEGADDHPSLWGTRRIGPDLTRAGGRQSHLWHLLHFENPPAVTPGSVMPAYPHLLRRRLDLEAIPPRLQALRAAGVPYETRLIDMSIADADSQARKLAEEIVQQGGPAGLEQAQVIALIAYLQQLGAQAPGGDQ